MKKLAILAAAISAFALAGTASAATAKLNAQVHLLSPDWHLVFQNLVDGNTNGFANERDSLCAGDSGSFTIQPTSGSPLKYSVPCVHFIDRRAGQTDIGFAYQSGPGEWTVWRIEDNNGALDQVTFFTSSSLVCAAFAVNEGYNDAARRSVCTGAFSPVTHAVVDQSSANVHLVR